MGSESSKPINDLSTMVVRDSMSNAISITNPLDPAQALEEAIAEEFERSLDAEFEVIRDMAVNLAKGFRWSRMRYATEAGPYEQKKKDFLLDEEAFQVSGCYIIVKNVAPSAPTPVYKYTMELSYRKVAVRDLDRMSVLGLNKLEKYVSEGAIE